MAMLSKEQRQAFSGMNLSEHEKRMKELSVELEDVKARIAETKANIQNLKADKKLIETISQNRDLIEDENNEGGLISSKQIAEPFHWIENPIESAPITREMSKEEKGLYTSLYKGKDLTEEEQLVANQMSMQDFENTGIPLVDKKVLKIETDDDISNTVEGRGLKGYKYPVPEKAMPGWKEDEGSNWSIDTESEYWSTKEGYDEAMRIYGFKPAWVQKPKKKGMITSSETSKRIRL